MLNLKRFHCSGHLDLYNLVINMVLTQINHMYEIICTVFLYKRYFFLLTQPVQGRQSIRENESSWSVSQPCVVGFKEPRFRTSIDYYPRFLPHKCHVMPSPVLLSMLMIHSHSLWIYTSCHVHLCPHKLTTCIFFSLSNLARCYLCWYNVASCQFTLSIASL